MKKYLLILLCAFAAISANAWVVTFSDDGHTAFIEGSGNDGQNRNDLKDANGNDVSDRVLAADSLKFSGTINTLIPSREVVLLMLRPLISVAQLLWRHLKVQFLILTLMVILRLLKSFRTA